jgi:hypothetical protein
MYHTVFDISDRYPDAIVCLLALGSIVPMCIVALRRTWRERFWVVSCLGLLWAAILWFFLSVHAVGGLAGLVQGSIGAVFALSFSRAIRKDGKLFPSDKRPVRSRSLGPFSAAAALALVAVIGGPYLGSLDLARQEAEGHASVVTGIVHDVRSVPGGPGYKPLHECFSVGPDQFCYDGISSGGFHQTADNGGPIRNGLSVRVTSIQGEIVRLEVASDP